MRVAGMRAGAAGSLEGDFSMADTMTSSMPRSSTSEAAQHTEGQVARTIEQQIARLPSDVFLWAGLGTLGLSCALQMAGRQHASLFIGQWAAPILILGLYNKVVKVAGSDRFQR
jgi:hypothetical protein